MATTITLTGELEARFQADAQKEGVPVETVVARRLEEAELIRRILAAFPPDESREFRSLIARRRQGTLTPPQAERLTALARRREEQNAVRFADILALARLRGIPHRTLMTEMGIRPARVV